MSDYIAYRGDRPHPQALDSEEAIIAGILIDPEAILRVKDIIGSEDFYFTPHRIIYAAALEVHRSGKPVDLMLVAQHLANHKLLDSVGGQTRLAALYGSYPSAVNVDLFAGLVLEKSIARAVIKIGGEVVDRGFDETQPAENLLPDISKLFRKLQTLQKVTGEGLVRVSESLADSFETIERLAQTGLTPGIKSGFYDLDYLTQGFQRGDLAIVAGRPSMGKTAFATHMALNIARAGKNAAFFSMEMSREQLVHRLISILSKVESGRMKAGHIYDNEWEKLGNACSVLGNIPFFIDSQGDLSVDSIEVRLDALESRTGEKVDIIFIDYLQLMRGESSFGGNKNSEVGSITRALKGLAISRGVTVVLLSQLSRGVESRQDKRPIMSDLRDSGSIEQDADLVLMLYRDEYYNSNTTEIGIAEVILNKHRNGPTGTIKLLFESQYTSFLNLARN